jgi:hypothetical protein
VCVCVCCVREREREREREKRERESFRRYTNQQPHHQSPVSARINAEALPTDRLTIFAKGERGEASVVASISFIPCERKRDASGKLIDGPQCHVAEEPVYRGISVEKTIRAFDPVEGVAVGPAIKTAASGTQVEVTIQV